MSNEFEQMVVSRLDEISGRLSIIETKIDEATSFADSVLGEDGVMPQDGLEALRSTFSSLLNPGAGATTSEAQEPQDIGNLVTSLKSFQERLTSVKEAMAEMPTQENDGDE